MGTPAGAPQQMPPGIAAGREVLDRVLHRLNEEPFRDRADAQAFLHACLEDERLATVDARQYFEWGIASILAGGWRPGHELLFTPAAQTFGWREDRSRLLWLGRPGEIVDDALVEQAAYDSQADVHRTLQRIAIRALRKPARPRTRELLQWLPAAEYAASAFPAWLHVITDPRQVQAWRAWDAEIPKWRRKLTRRPKALRVAAAAGPKKKFTFGWNWSWGWGIFLLISVARVLTSVSSPPKPVTVPPSLAVPVAATPAPFPPLATRPLTRQEEDMRVWKESVYRKSLADAVRPAIDYPEAKDRLARLARTTGATPARCQSLAEILRDQGAAHERGDFGPRIDDLVVDCAVRKQGGLDRSAVMPSSQRNIRRARAEIDRLKAPSARQAAGLPDPAPTTPAPAALPFYKTKPASPFDLAPGDSAPVTTEHSGLGLKPSGR